MADEKPKSALEQAIDTFEKETSECTVIRKEMIASLREDCKKMRVSEYDKAMMVTAKMSMVTTLNGMLKDVEDSAIKRVKFRMTQNEQENSGQYAQQIVQLLKMVRCDGKDAIQNAPVQNEADVQAEIAKRGEELKIELLPGETENCEGLPGKEGYKQEEAPPEVNVEPKEETKVEDEPEPKQSGGFGF